ncbi:response regulator [Paenibacillus oryzae]|uniref:response regulator n=1 Tax=Paenibacillus oryzae TaxID=1844972 RepID=UPI000AA1D4A7
MSESGYCRVLIVDDEVLIRQGIKHFMNWEQEGFQIVGEASNGVEALRMIQELSPHIVITDIVMPLMDGEELTKEIKLKHPEIEVIVLSSFGEYQYVRSTFQNGVADYILKPKLDIQHLLAVLKLAVKRIPSLQQGSSGSFRLSGDRLLEMVLGGYESDYPAEDVQAAFPYPLFRLVAVNQSSGNGRHDEQAGINGAAVQTELAERLSKIDESEGLEAVFYRLPAYSGFSIAVVNGAAEAMEALEHWVSEQVNEIAGSIVAVTDVFRELGETRPQYRNSLLKLLDYSFFLPEVRLLKKVSCPRCRSRRSRFI